MYDYEKIKILFTSGKFKFDTNVKTMAKKKSITYPLILNKIINSFNDELNNLGEKYDLHKYNTKRSHVEFYDHYLTLIKENIPTYQDLYENYFGKESSNVFTYLNQIIHKQPKNHKKFYEDADESFYIRCRYHIAKCANVNIETLKANSKEEFKLLLEQDLGFIETDESFDINIDENDTVYKFELFNLRQILSEKDFDENFIGLKELEKFKYPVPKFLDNNTISENKLLKHIYIEGFYGTGKTTLAEQISYYISKNNSYYFDFKLYEEKSDISTQLDDIAQFVKFVSSTNGVIILDNINVNSYTAYITSVFINESEKLNLKLILIAKLEQHNRLSNIHTFFDKYSQKENSLEKNCFKVELSSRNSQHSTRINILKNFLYNYLSIKGKDDLLPLSDQTLNRLDQDFNGLLYLLKVAIDNQDFSSLEELSVESADKIIHSKYNLLLNNLDNEYILNLIILSSFDIYMRVEQLFYNQYFTIKNKVVLELEEQKRLYIIKDIKFNSNYVIYFPNLLVPKKLAEFIFYDKKYNLDSLLKSEENINSFLDLGINNFMNIINYLYQKEEYDKIVNLIPYLCYDDFFHTKALSKISIRDMMLLISVCIKYEQKNKNKIFKNDAFLRLYENFMKEHSRQYLAHILSKASIHTIVEWMSMLNSSLRKYHRIHKKKISTLKFNKEEKKHITRYRQKNKMIFEHQYGEILYRILKSTIVILFQEHYVDKHSEDIIFLENLITVLKETDGGYEWDIYIEKANKILHKQNLKIQSD